MLAVIEDVLRRAPSNPRCSQGWPNKAQKCNKSVPQGPYLLRGCRQAADFVRVQTQEG